MKDVKREGEVDGRTGDMKRKLSGQVHSFMKASGGAMEPICYSTMSFFRSGKEAADDLRSIIFSHTISYFHKPWKKSAS